MASKLSLFCLASFWLSLGACQGLEGGGSTAVEAGVDGGEQELIDANGPNHNQDSHSGKEGDSSGQVEMDGAHPEAKPSEDLTQPRVLSTFPESGASGVSNSTRAKIVFSEPMDRAATEAAITVVGATELQFEWSQNGAAVEFFPRSGWPYAEGIFPGPEASRFEATLSNKAKDLAGNAVVLGSSWWFRSLRRLTWLLPLQSNRTGYLFLHEGNVSIDLTTMYIQGPRDRDISAVLIATFEREWPPTTVEVQSALLRWSVADKGDANAKIKMEAVKLSTLTPSAYYLRGSALGVEDATAGDHTTDVLSPLKAAFQMGNPARISVLFWTDTSFATYLGKDPIVEMKLLLP